MMKTIKLILLFAGLLLFFRASNAQNVTYGYDAAGNRISRTIVMQTSSFRSATIEEEEEEEEKEEEEATAYSEILSEVQIKIYPNPTKGLLHVEIQNLPPDVTARIALYQLSGKLLILKEDVTYSTEIDITGQPTGTYLLKIVAGKEQTEWKIIKQ
jgi:YD repeat-containing protein